MSGNIQTSSQNIQRMLEELEGITSTPGKGWTRLPFSPEARSVVEYLKRQMTAAGMTVYEDAAGSIFGRLEGTQKDHPAILIGSHYDSVKNGGRFDGIAGILTGLDIVRRLTENGVTLPYPLEIVGTNDEEGVRFGTGFFGTKALLGEISAQELAHLKDEDGVTLWEAMQGYGLDPARIGQAIRPTDQIKAFIEVHIEQGPVLDREKIELGLVQGIVGMQRYMVTIRGRADHAGSTPMPMRLDAMDAACKAASMLADWAREKTDGTVATVGYIKAQPNAMNIVAEQVEFSVDIRSEKEASVQEIAEKLETYLKHLCRKFGITYTLEQTLKEQPVHLNETLLENLEKVCRNKNYTYRRMVSGAGHDSLVMGRRVPAVMLFVPSKNGRSHCPEEWSDCQDLAKASEVIYEMLQRLPQEQ